MRRSPVLSPAKATLLMLGIGTAALMGVPGVGSYVPPNGALGGIVLDESGEPVPEAMVALFHGDELDLIEITHSDRHGRFAFQHAPWAYHLFLSPSPDSGRVGTWLLARESGPTHDLELVATRGVPVEVRVTDEAGSPLEGVEVRTYHAGPAPAVVARKATDTDGVARVTAPLDAHVAALGGPHGRLNAWSRQRELPGEGGRIELVLEPARELGGRVVDPEGAPLAEVIVSVWRQEPDGWSWVGYERTSEKGFFTVLGSETTRLRVLDPTQRFLPREHVVAAGAPSWLELSLEPGRPLEIVCSSVANEPVPSRVWIWSDEVGTWSWGSPTDEEGLLEASTTPGFAVVAEPLYAPGAPTEVWDRSYERPRLELTHLYAP